MALTLAIQNKALGRPGSPREYTIDAAELATGGAFTTFTITLDTLPAGAVVQTSRVWHSAAVVGTSISAATARVVFAGTSLGSGTLDIFQASSGTTDIVDLTGAKGSVTATNALTLALTTTGGNFSVITAGSVHVWVDYSVLAPAVLIS